MQCSIPLTVMPDIPVWVCTAIASGLTAKVNNKGDRGQPGLVVDLCKLKGFDMMLLVNISTVGFVHSSRVHLRKFLPSPNLGSTLKR